MPSDLEAVADGADDVGLAHEDLVERQLAGGRAAHAHLVLQLGDGEARAVGLDQERRHALGGGRRGVGDREDDVGARHAGAADPVLGAGDRPPAVDARRASAQRARVGSGVGLGQRERRQPLARGVARQHAVLQLRGAVEADRQGAEVLDGEHQRAARARLGDLLDRHHRHQRAGPGATVALVERQRQDVVRGEDGADVLRELAGGVDGRGARGDLVGDQRADRAAKVLLLAREPVLDRAAGDRAHAVAVTGAVAGA
jgi:hypothetical protein